MKELKSITREEKNLEIAKLLYPENEVQTYNGHVEVNFPTLKHNIPNWKSLNYYSNWNDLMPEIVKVRIDLTDLSRLSNETRWAATHWYDRGDKVTDYSEVLHDNPQVALADCLLLVLRELNESKGEQL